MSKFAESFLGVASITKQDDDDETTSGDGGTGSFKVDEITAERTLSNMPWFLYPANNR